MSKKSLEEGINNVRLFRYYSRDYLENVCGVRNLELKANEARISRDVYRYNSNFGEMWLNLKESGADRYQVVYIGEEDGKTG